MLLNYPGKLKLEQIKLLKVFHNKFLGIERAKLKSEELSNALRNSRVKREEDDKDFIVNL
jgi:hypothetical protein